MFNRFSINQVRVNVRPDQVLSSQIQDTALYYIDQVSLEKAHQANNLQVEEQRHTFLSGKTDPDL